MFSYEINDKDALDRYLKIITELITEDLYWIHIRRHVLNSSQRSCTEFISEDIYWIDHRGLVLNSYQKTCTELLSEDMYWIDLRRRLLKWRHVLKQTCTGLSSEDVYWIVIRRHVLNVFRVLDWALKMSTELLVEKMYWMYFGYWIELWRCVLNC